MDKSEYVTIGQFAIAHRVPKEAVLHAIELRKLPTENITLDGEPVIHAKYLLEYEFELIGVYDYAKRKNVTEKAVYKRLESPRRSNRILFTVDEKQVMKVDWQLYKDEKFRLVNYKFRKKRVA